MTHVALQFYILENSFDQRSFHISQALITQVHNFYFDMISRITSINIVIIMNVWKIGST